MLFIDTNIILEILLGQEKKEECEKIFEALQDKKIDAVCSHFSIHSICVIMDKRGKHEKSVKMLKFLLSLQNLMVMNTCIEDDIEIMAIAHETGLDFDDALQFHVARETGCEAIVTLDRKFRGKGINALAPQEALEQIT